jgi:hypothetical protein
MTGLLLIFLLACNINLTAQRGMRSLRMDSMHMRNDSAVYPRHMQRGGFHDMGRQYASRDFGRGMQHFRGMGPEHEFRYGMMPGPGRMNPGMRPMPYVNRRPQGMAPGGRMMENIPGLTDKQKQDLEKLNEKQREDMQNLMKDRQEKMKELRESHRENLLKILNDDQKKWLEEHDPADRI